MSFYSFPKTVFEYYHEKIKDWVRAILPTKVSDLHNDSDFISQVDLGGVIASIFSTSTSYLEGAYVIHNMHLYRAKEAVSAGDWDSTKWASVLLVDVYNKDNTGRPGLVPARVDSVGTKVLSQAGTWINVSVEGTLTEEDLYHTIVGEFDSSIDYAKGDCCIYNKFLYRAKNAVPQGGEWTGGTDWEIVSIPEVIDGKIASLGTILHYKGGATAQTLNNSTDWENGAVYSLTTEGDLTDHDLSWDGHVKVGDEVAWDEEHSYWVFLGNVTEIPDFISEEDLQALICKPYDPTATYDINDLVFVGRTLYKCTTAVTEPKAWDENDWTPFKIDVFQGATVDGNSAPGLVPKAVSADVNKVLGADGQWHDYQTPMDMSPYVTEENLGDVIADLYDDSTVYHLNDYVIQDKTLYRCKVAVTTAGEWDEDHWSDSWQKINIARIFSTTAPGLVPAPTAQDVTDKNLLAADGTFVPHQDLSEYIKELNLGDIVAEVFSTSKTYAVNSYVIHDKKLYRCTTAVQTAGDWSSSNWTQVRSTDTFQGSAPGLVPTAGIGDANKTLKGDGSWSDSVRIIYDAQTEELQMDFSPYPNEVLIGGRWYPYVQIGNQLWLAENLDYIWSGLQVNPNASSRSVAYAYYTDDTYRSKYGILYNGTAVSYLESNASNIFPTGWNIPTKSQFDELITYAGGSSSAGAKLKSTTDWCDDGNGTDDYGFNALPAGRSESSIILSTRNAWIWSGNSDMSGYRYRTTLDYNSNRANNTTTTLEYGCSIRLVKTLT